MPEQPAQPIPMTTEQMKWRARLLACKFLLEARDCDSNETVEIRFDIDTGSSIAINVGPMIPGEVPAAEQPRVNGEQRNGVHPSPK